MSDREDMTRRPLRTYGRRGGRPLSERQKDLFETLLPQLRVPVGEPGALDPGTLFDAAREIWLEIGFGGGEHTTGQALKHQNVGLLASEVFIEGMAKCLGQIDDAGISNVRLWEEDARELMLGLKESCLDRAFILFPDPWPKTKQQKRRLIKPDFLDELSRLMRPQGVVRFATDVRSYADEALERFLAHPDFRWTAKTADDWRQVPTDHIQTRYQTKNLGDIAPVYYEFRRR